MFIYVFTERERDKLQSSGFVLLKSDEENGIFIFASDDNLRDVLSLVSYLPSNTLTF